MSSKPLRPLPTLTLPAAFLHLWGSSAHDQRIVGTVAAFAAYPSIAQLGERLLAVVPELGREDVLDDAVTLAQAVLSRLRQVGAEEEIAGILIFPGLVSVRAPDPRAMEDDPPAAPTIEPISDEFLQDLRRQAPSFPTPGIYLTGRAASWLHGQHQIEAADFYEGPSGRRVPFHRLSAAGAETYPWHNPELLGRRVQVSRGKIRAGLAAASEGQLQVLGGMGVGKSHAVWHYLQEQEGPKLWFRAGRSLFATPGLTRGLVTELYQLAPGALPPGADELRQPERVAPERAAPLLLAWLGNARERLGAPLWLVCDMLHTAVPGDLDLLSKLVASPHLGHAFRAILIARSGGQAISRLVGMPELEIPPLAPEELTTLSGKLVAGLSLNSEVEKRLVTAAAGYPLAFEEGLVRLVHRGLIRRVYGAFFFDGSSDVEYEPSPRLVSFVEAEVRRLGEPLPLRILAAANQPVPATYLDVASTQFGVTVPAGWEKSFLATGWLKESSSAWGPGIAFACPAFCEALSSTVDGESREALRQALGQVVAPEAPSADPAWQAYQLLAGSADALPALLGLSRTTDGHTSREEIFVALEREYRAHQERGGSPTTELDLLWTLLPLGHRLGKLDGLEAELDRAVELAANDPARLGALAMLKAEHAHDHGRYQEAEKGFRLALKASEGNEQKRGLLFIRLGRILLRQERYEEARMVFQNTLGVVDRTGPTTVGATCSYFLGNIALAERQLAEAADHHGRALAVRRQHNLRKPISASLSSHGTLAIARGDYPRALAFYREAEAILDEESDEEGELAYALLGEGRALGALGDYLAATKPIRRGLELRVGRSDPTGEAIARLDLAANHLDLDKLDEALTEARLAYFRLCLLPPSSIRGDAEQLLGRILLRQRQKEEALERFQDAQTTHLNRCNRMAAAVDTSWLLELAIQRNDQAVIVDYTTELVDMLEDLPNPLHGELLYFRLYRAFHWLRERKAPAHDPIDYLRKAYQELIRKTGFLAPEMRHPFLFSIREHQDLLNAATEHQISLPAFSPVAVMRDAKRSSEDVAAKQ